MFLKVIYKKLKNSTEHTAHYRLCESYRAGGSVRHQTILHLGRLEELPDIEQKKALALRINELVREHKTGGRLLFKATDSTVEQLAQTFFKQICEQQHLDILFDKDYERINTKSITNKDVREVGAEWMCLQALEQLKIAPYLQQCGWTQQDIQLALTHITSRAVYPASELQTSQWIVENSSICELTGYPVEKITKDKLYQTALRLYRHKNGLEKHLSIQTNELFDLNDKIILYDLTNTYFEGRMKNSLIATFGRSKEKRSDARLVVLALVVNMEGFLKYSQIFVGNMNDAASLPQIIEDLSKTIIRPANSKPVVVLDAGIASEANLELLTQAGYRYMCVSRSGMQKYQVDSSAVPVRITDNKKQVVTLQKVTIQGSTDKWLLVHSHAKEAKEASMNARFVKRFEAGLQNINDSLHKKGGIKKQQKVWQRIGRLQEQYPGVFNRYEITAQPGDKDTIVSLQWCLKAGSDADELQHGHYLLRTTVDDSLEEIQWDIYNTIREIEATIRVLKTDLDLRPIYHKSDAGAMAHLHLGLLAYWVVNTIRYQLKQKGIHTQWAYLVRTMNTQKLVTTSMVSDHQQLIRIRQCSEPHINVGVIYSALNYKHQPFYRKKSVVPLCSISKNQNHSPGSFPPS